ncbi:hypothetical protein J2Y38_002439 [Flavobacterium sp. 2755]|nr:hypothetical protein [Flavobacterium sp. 2755]
MPQISQILSDYVRRKRNVKGKIFWICEIYGKKNRKP